MLEPERQWLAFYDRWAGTYDFGVWVFSLLIGFRDARERRRLVSRLQLKAGARVLEVSVGTGSNLPLIEELIGPGGLIVGLDFSFHMLTHCRRKADRLKLRAHLIDGEAAFLPIRDNVFDGVLNFGGMNALGDQRKGIEEMIRVAKPGARIVISDQGLPLTARTSFRNRLLVGANPLYASEPPIRSIPPGARDVRLTWFRGDSAYILDFLKP